MDGRGVAVDLCLCLAERGIRGANGGAGDWAQDGKKHWWLPLLWRWFLLFGGKKCAVVQRPKRCTMVRAPIGDEVKVGCREKRRGPPNGGEEVSMDELGRQTEDNCLETDEVTT